MEGTPKENLVQVKEGETPICPVCKNWELLRHDNFCGSCSARLTWPKSEEESKQ